jgi:hypothetical protein
MALYAHYSLQLFPMWDNNIQHPPSLKLKQGGGSLSLECSETGF